MALCGSAPALASGNLLPLPHVDCISPISTLFFSSLGAPSPRARRRRLSAVLFKLQQMQKVDLRVLSRLLERFNEIDTDGTGAVDVGVEVIYPLGIYRWDRSVGAVDLGAEASSTDLKKPPYFV